MNDGNVIFCEIKMWASKYLSDIYRKYNNIIAIINKVPSHL